MYSTITYIYQKQQLIFNGKITVYGYTVTVLYSTQCGKIFILSYLRCKVANLVSVNPVPYPLTFLELFQVILENIVR